MHAFVLAPAEDALGARFVPRHASINARSGEPVNAHALHHAFHEIGVTSVLVQDPTAIVAHGPLHQKKDSAPEFFSLATAWAITLI
jgi:hypothetical protein